MTRMTVWRTSRLAWKTKSLRPGSILARIRLIRHAQLVTRS